MTNVYCTDVEAHTSKHTARTYRERERERNWQAVARTHTFTSHPTDFVWACRRFLANAIWPFWLLSSSSTSFSPVMAAATRRQWCCWWWQWRQRRQRRQPARCGHPNRILCIACRGLARFCVWEFVAFFLSFSFLQWWVLCVHICMDEYMSQVIFWSYMAEFCGSNEYTRDIQTLNDMHSIHGERMCDDHFNAQHYNFQLLTFAYTAAAATASTASAAAVAILSTRNTTHTHFANK